MSDRDTYIKRYENARQEMRDILKLTQGNPTIYEAWRIKEVLDHITGWDDAEMDSIKSFLSGELPAMPAARGIDVYNAETVSSREAIPYEITQREWETSRAELLSLLRKISNEQCIHLLSCRGAHKAQLKIWLKSLPNMKKPTRGKSARS